MWISVRSSFHIVAWILCRILFATAAKRAKARCSKLWRGRMNTFTRRFGLKMGAALGAMAAAGSLVSITYAEVKPIGEPDPELVPTVGGEVVVGANELGDTLDPHKTG